MPEMTKARDLLGDIAKRTGNLHQQLVKQTLLFLTVGVVLAVTLATAVKVLRQAGVADLQREIQSQMSAAGEYAPGVDNAWQLFDECGVIPVFAQQGQAAKTEVDRKAAAANAEQLLQTLHEHCQTLHPFQLTVKLLDYPITVDLMVWGFVLPLGFLFVLAWIFRLRIERTLLIRAGTALSCGVPANEEPLDATMLFRDTRYGEAMNRQAADWSERLLIVGLFGAAGFVSYRLWLLWAPLDKLVLMPLEKIYGLAATLLLCTLADCDRRLRDEIAFATGVVLEPAVGWQRMRRTAEKVWSLLRSGKRRLPMRGAAFAGGVLGIISLFLACGMEGCDEPPISGYRLFEAHWVTLSGKHGMTHQIVFPGNWYFGGDLHSVVSEIGRWSYAVGIVLAAVALVAVAVSFFQRGVSRMVLRHSVFQTLTLSSVLYLCYELAWNDYILFWWPVAAGAATLSLCCAWPPTRRCVYGVLSRVTGERPGLYLTGLGIYTGLLALLGMKMVVVQRFWGILAFFAGLMLLTTASSLAAEMRESGSGHVAEMERREPVMPH